MEPNGPDNGIHEKMAWQRIFRSDRAECFDCSMLSCRSAKSNRTPRTKHYIKSSFPGHYLFCHVAAMFNSCTPVKDLGSSSDTF